MVGFGPVGCDSHFFSLSLLGPIGVNRKEKTIPTGPLPTGAFPARAVAGDLHFYLYLPSWFYGEEAAAGNCGKKEIYEE